VKPTYKNILTIFFFILTT